MSLASWWRRTGVYSVLKHGMKGFTVNGQSIFGSGGILDRAWMSDGGLRSFLQKIFGSAEDMLDMYTGHGMTTAQKEQSDYQRQQQDWLNSAEYERKIDFFTRFESFPAQVEQMQQAGLNPAMMYGGSPSASASGGIGTPGSAGMPSGSSSGALDFISSIARIAQEGELRNRDLDLQAEGLEIQRVRTDAQTQYWEHLNDLNDARAEAQRVINEFLPSQQTLDMMSKDVNVRDMEVQLKKHEKEVLQMDHLIRQIDANIEYLQSGARLNEQRRTEIVQSIKNLKQQYELLGRQIKLSDKDIEYYLFNHSKVLTDKYGASILGIGVNTSQPFIVGPDGRLIDPVSGSVKDPDPPAPAPPYQGNYTRKTNSIHDGTAQYLNWLRDEDPEAFERIMNSLRH